MNLFLLAYIDLKQQNESELGNLLGRKTGKKVRVQHTFKRDMQVELCQ